MENTDFNSVANFPQLTKAENIIFKFACQQAILQGYSILSIGDLWDGLQDIGITDLDLFSSFDSLRKKKYFNVFLSSFEKGEVLYMFSITRFGLDLFISRNYRDIHKLYEDLWDLIKHLTAYLKKAQLYSDDLALKLKTPKLIINHILEELQYEGKIVLNQNTIYGNWELLKIVN